jgi:hypothetical protein
MDAHFTKHGHGRSDGHGRLRTVIDAHFSMDAGRTFEDVCKNLSRYGQGHASES